jgi:two-component system, NtrC family, response regulator GlrR
MIGHAPVFQTFLRMVEKVAACDAPVLIEGETGTGKELTARSIHYSGPRKDMPFIPVNCGALQDTLIESELFGHRKGAFTDAKERQLGLVAHAEGGTLFLDEIEALSPKAQVTLLRFLQDHHYRPLGSKELLSAKVRIIAASNMNLTDLTQTGKFRMDLLFRLRILCLEVPPLRQRKEDIPQLAQHFAEVACARYGCSPKTLGPRALEWLLRQPWPGNVRELENAIHSAVLFSESDTLKFPPHETPEELSDRINLPPKFQHAKREAIDTFERIYLSEIMRNAQGNVSLAAQLAGKERRTMGRLLKKHGFKPKDFREIRAAF